MVTKRRSGDMLPVYLRIAVDVQTPINAGEDGVREVEQEGGEGGG